MGRRTLFTNLRLMGMAVCLFFVSANAPAQSTVGSDTAETGPVLIKLSTPEYPPLARMARISGDVEVTVSIRKDGAVESAEATGHPLLKRAALESAQKSTFECRGCTNEAKHLLTFSFELKGDGKCGESGQPSEVTQLGDRITIVALPICPSDIGSIRPRARSLKCLYLWRCGPS